MNPLLTFGMFCAFRAKCGVSPDLLTSGGCRELRVQKGFVLTC